MQKTLYKTYLKPFLAVIVAIYLAACTFYLVQSPADAVSAGDFKAGQIIDDAVFYNAGSMSVDQIQRFLESKAPGACNYTTDAWHILKSKDPNNPNAYNSFCLKELRLDTKQREAASGFCAALPAQKNITAAKYIHSVAQACGINPQVLLTLLEKEQGMITDKWINTLQYGSSTGYACPDFRTCDPRYAGFDNQIYEASRQFKVYKAYPTSYNYIAGRTNRISWQAGGGTSFYNPTGSVQSGKPCGYSNVTIVNQATAALYIYTPYQPNKASLNSYPGTGDACSAYGNRNFWFMFSGWFGSTQSVEAQKALTAIETRYTKIGGAKSALGQVVGSISKSNHTYWIKYQNGYIIWSPASGAWESYGKVRDRWLQLGTETGAMGHPTGGIVTMPDGGQYQKYQNGYIIGTTTTGYWESKGSIRDKWATTGYQDGSLGYPAGPEINAARNVWYQKFQNGVIFGAGPSGFWTATTTVFNHWLSNGGADNPTGLPTTDAAKTTAFLQQTYTAGVKVRTTSGTLFDMSSNLYASYLSLGGTNSKLGQPAANAGSDANGVTWQRFTNGYLIGNGDTFFESRGPIRNRWAALNFQDGQLGMPEKNITTGPDGKTTWQKYQGGYFISDPNNSNIAWESTGDIRTQWAKLGYQDGILGYPTGPETKIDGVWSQTYQHGVIYSQNWKHWYVVKK